MCHHDKSALRTTGIDKEIREMTLAEVKLLDCGSWFSCDWKNERIPKLDEVLRILPNDKDIFIEVKTNKKIVPFLLKDIKKNEIDLDRLTVITFFPEVINEIKKNNPDIRCNLLIAFDYKEIRITEILESVVDIGANGVGAQNHEKLNIEFIQTLRGINRTSHVWTVNSCSEAEEYLKNGIDSITTNKPLYLRSYLEKLNY